MSTMSTEWKELHRRGRLPFDRLITHYPLAEINRATPVVVMA